MTSSPQFHQKIDVHDSTILRRSVSDSEGGLHKNSDENVRYFLLFYSFC